MPLLSVLLYHIISMLEFVSCTLTEHTTPQYSFISIPINPTELPFHLSCPHKVVRIKYLLTNPGLKEAGSQIRIVVVM